MEQFVAEVRDYAARLGVSPSTVIQRVGVSGGKWARWEEGVGSPTLQTADRIRAYMLDNPPPEEDRAARVG
jgi:transcriptional regulator with XRE-family HTH domain